MTVPGRRSARPIWSRFCYSARWLPACRSRSAPINYESAENGETAVVVINNQEVTLKKLYIEKSGVRLQPANQDMQPIYLKNDDIQVPGLVMGVMRQPAHAA